jgi:16S rRNA U516 pseudouridylate synthase RsuA-like enzyme
MFRAVGNRVKRLHREKINQIFLDVELSQSRYLRITKCGRITIGGGEVR